MYIYAYILQNVIFSRVTFVNIEINMLEFS